MKKLILVVSLIFSFNFLEALGEANGYVRLNKGILEASESEGIKLSPEAIRNFEIKTHKIISDGPWLLPNSARFYSAEEINLYRLRDGFFKRIDFKELKRTSNLMVVGSKDIKVGDEIVIFGLGYLRIAELSAFGGIDSGHAH